MKRNFYLLASALTLLATSANATVFNSNGTGGGVWTNAATWSYVSGPIDTDGIPDSNDDITILGGDVVTFSTNEAVQAVTISGTLQLTGGTVRTLAVYGNYTNNGTELGNYAISFRGLNTCTISGSGTWNPSVRWTFSSGRTISAGTIVTKSAMTSFYNGSDVTNLGDVRMQNTTCIDPGSVWINGSGSILRLTTGGFMNGGSLDASATPNSVSTSYGFLTSIPNPLGSTYYNLVIGPAGTTRLPADITVLNNFTMTHGSTFNTNGFDMSVGRNITFPALFTFSMNAGDVLTLNGSSSAQTITNNSTTTIINYQNLVINNANGVTMTGAGGDANILQSITLTDGFLNLNASVILTMVSTAAQTARIGISSATAFFNSNVTVQRFIDARADGYSDMSSPVSGATIADWDNELTMIYTYNPPSAYPSAYRYSEGAWDYIPVTTSAQPMTPGTGFELYLATDGLESTPFNATTLDTRGIPNVGNVDISGTMTMINDGWNLIGNPYASHLDWDLFEASASGNYGGSWMFYDETIEDFNTASSGTIAPGEGFWVEVLGPAPSPTFTESMKSTSLSSSFRKKGDDYFSLQLKTANVKFTSNTRFAFGDGTRSYERGLDVPFRGLPHPSAPQLYSLTTENKKLRVNHLEQINEVSIPLGIQAGVEGEYSIEAINAFLLEDAGYTCAILEDKLTGKFHNLLTANYYFSTPAEKNESRFVLHLGNTDCKAATTVEATAMNANVYSIAEGMTIAFNLNETMNTEIIVTNAVGQQIVPSVNVEAFQQKMNMNLPANYHGLVLVTLQSGTQRTTYKIMK